jgi:hypothetical protein
MNIPAATNTGNSRGTAVSMRRPVNNFTLKNVTTRGNPLLRDTRCDWLLDYVTSEWKMFSVRSVPRLYNESCEL